MEKCCFCDANIDTKPNACSRNIGVCHDDLWYCLPCNDARIFMDTATDACKVIIKDVEEKPKTLISTSTYSCIKCKIPYVDNKCSLCNGINPLILPRTNAKKKYKNSKNK